MLQVDNGPCPLVCVGRTYTACQLFMYRFFPLGRSARASPGACCRRLAGMVHCNKLINLQQHFVILVWVRRRTELPRFRA